MFNFVGVDLLWGLWGKMAALVYFFVDKLRGVVFRIFMFTQILLRFLTNLCSALFGFSPLFVGRVSPQSPTIINKTRKESLFLWI